MVAVDEQQMVRGDNEHREFKRQPQTIAMMAAGLRGCCAVADQGTMPPPRENGERQAYGTHIVCIRGIVP